MKTNGEKISSLRKLKNLTQADLGAELNVTSQAVSKWERDESEPDFATLTKMCKIFDITLDDFVNENFKVVSYDVAEVTEEKNSDLLGVCTSCGITVREDNLGINVPKMLCTSCHKSELERLKNEALRLENIRLENERIAAEKIKGSKSSIIRKYIFSGIIGIVLLIFGFISAIKSNDTFAEILFNLVFSIWVFTFIYQLLTPESFARGALHKFSWIMIRMPGIIFELSLDGIIWLLTIKLLFWLISITLGLLAITLGLLLGFLVAFFTFPFLAVKEIAELRA